ncbi:UNVERIFIED_CONTAM: hypothetical protein FKN15_035854 [Acipenser sinensis]
MHSSWYFCITVRKVLIAHGTWCQRNSVSAQTQCRMVHGARRQLWLSQARVPDAVKAELLDVPISPGHTFGPVVEEILQRSHWECKVSQLPRGAGRTADELLRRGLSPGQFQSPVPSSLSSHPEPSPADAFEMTDTWSRPAHLLIEVQNSISLAVLPLNQASIRRSPLAWRCSHPEPSTVDAFEMTDTWSRPAHLLIEVQNSISLAVLPLNQA